LKQICGAFQITFRLLPGGGGLVEPRWISCASNWPGTTSSWPMRPLTFASMAALNSDRTVPTTSSVAARDLRSTVRTRMAAGGSSV